MRKQTWILPILVITLVLVSSTLLAGCGPGVAEQLPSIVPWQAPKVTTDSIKLTNTEPDNDGIELLGVGLAEEGAMIIMKFTGPGKVIQAWNQGDIYIVDEANDTGYDQIPVAPVIGPLFGKPTSEGPGRGYVMLNNPSNGIKYGSVVTAVLGKYKRMHITVQ
jgi:hypothetical protein